MRSAKAPTISATVMAAKVALEGHEHVLGNGGEARRRCRASTPFRNSLSKPPKNRPSPLKARL
jgi:hypothetical protein